MPLPIPTNNTENTDKIYFEIYEDGGSNRYKLISIMTDIIIIFKIDPIPGFCLMNIHKDKTPMLTKNVAAPMLKFVTLDTPSAKTVQGELPVVDTTNNPSPKPKKVKPKHKNKKVEIFGLKFNGFSELHFFLGIFFMVKNMVN